MDVYLTPSFVFHISTVAEIMGFVFFMIVALFLSHIILKTKKAFNLLKQRENNISVLYRFIKIFNERRNDKDFRSIFFDALAGYFKCDFVFLSVSDGELEASAFPQHPNFNQKELIAAKWSFKYGSACGKGTNTFTGLDWAIQPLVIEN